MDSSANVETLGVRVEGSGIEETKQSLDQLTLSAGKAEASTKSLRDATGGLSKAQQEIARMAREVAEAVRTANLADATRVNALQAEIDTLKQLAGATQNFALVERDLADAQARLNTIQKDTAPATDAVVQATKRATSAGDSHGLQLGRLRQELGTLVGRLTETSTALDRMGAAIGAMAGGNALTIGVLAGIVAISFAYEKLTASTREAAKAADEFAKTQEGRAASATGLGIVANARVSAGSNSVAGGLDIPALSEESKKAQDAVDGLLAKLSSLDVGGGAGSTIAGGPTKDVRELIHQFELGQGSATDFLVRIQAIGAAHPFDAVVEKASDFGQQLLVAKERAQALQNAIQQATAQQNYYTLGLNASSVSEGKLFEQTKQRESVLAAIRAGGTVGGDRASDQNEALSIAQKLYEEAATSGKHAELATVAFQDALKNTASVAHGFAVDYLADGQKFVATGRAISDTLKQQTTAVGDTSRLTSLTDQIERFGAEVGNIGKDASITARVDAMSDALSKLETDMLAQVDAGKATGAEFDAFGAKVEGARQQLFAFGDQAKQAATDQVQKSIHEQYTATNALYTALVDGTGAYHDLTAAKRAQLEIDKQLTATNGKLSADAQQEIRDTQLRQAAIEDAKGTSAIIAQTTAIKAEVDAIQSGASSRATYAADLKYQTELAVASLIPAGAVHDARVKAVEDNHAASVSLALLKDSTNAVTEAVKKSNEAYAAVTTSIEKDLLRSVQQFATQGITSFRSFFSEVESLSLRMVGQLDGAIKKMSEGWATAYESGDEDAAKSIDGQLRSLEKLRGISADVGAAITGGFAGYNVGRATNNTGYGELAGGAAGALTGAATAGPLGAVIGGFAGVIGGLLGAAAAHKEAAHQIDEAAKSLQLNLRSFNASSGVEQSLADNQARADALRQQAEDLENARIKNARGGPNEVVGIIGDFNQTQAEIVARAAINVARITADFLGGITSQLNELRGPAGALDNQLASLKKAYDDNVASANALGQPLDDINKLYDAQVAAAKAAYAEGQSQLRLSEDAREAAARGNDVLAASITRRAQEEDELFKDSQAGYTDAQLARVKYIQGLEDERAAILALIDAQNTLAQNTAKGPTGTLTDQQNADLAPLIQKRDTDLGVLGTAFQTWMDDILHNADASKTAADYQAYLTAKTVALGDQAAITAAQFANAAQQMSAAQSAIQRDIKLGFTTPEKGRELEAHAFGFDGLSNQQIRDLYTPYAGTSLSNENETRNKNIAQFLQDFPDAVQQAIADATSAASSKSPAGDAVQYAARAISEVTANRLADYEATQTNLLRDIRDDARQHYGQGAVDFSTLPAPRVDFPTLANWLPSSGASVPAAASAPQSSGPVVQGGGIIIENLTVRIDGADLTGLNPDEIKTLARKVGEELVTELQGVTLANGNPTLLFGGRP